MLLTVIFLNSVICCPIYAEPIFEDNAVAEDIFDSENTECSLETTTISNIPDEVESSSGIIADIIGSINDVFKNDEVDNNNDVIEVEDTVLSDAALDFELDTSEMTEEVKDLLNGKNHTKNYHNTKNIY